MIPSRAEEGLKALSTDIRNVLNKHEQVTTTEKDGKIVNIINNYKSGKSTRFGFFSTVGIIVKMIPCGIALAVGWTLVNSPVTILSLFVI